MDKMLVAIFDSGSKAYEGARILQELDADGSLTLFAFAVIEKDAGGTVTIEQSAEEGPVATAAGFLAGGLIGGVAGPAGVAVGGAAGSLAGTLYDIAQLGVSEDFLAEVGRSLQPGKSAVVAEVEEEWVTPADSRLEAAGALVLRRARGELVHAHIDRDIAALEAEIADLRAESRNASGAARARLQSNIAAGNAQLQALQERAKAASDAARSELDAKLKRLEQRAGEVQGDAKAKLEARIARLRSDSKQRLDKLHQAWERAKQALAA
jgi:uncharacterized membrane protein